MTTILILLLMVIIVINSYVTADILNYQYHNQHHCLDHHHYHEAYQTYSISSPNNIINLRTNTYISRLIFSPICHHYFDRTFSLHLFGLSVFSFLVGHVRSSEGVLKGPGVNDLLRRKWERSREEVKKCKIMSMNMARLGMTGMIIGAITRYD